MCRKEKDRKERDEREYTLTHIFGCWRGWFGGGHVLGLGCCWWGNMLWLWGGGGGRLGRGLSWKELDKVVWNQSPLASQ